MIWHQPIARALRYLSLVILALLGVLLLAGTAYARGSNLAVTPHDSALVPSEEAPEASTPAPTPEPTPEAPKPVEGPTVVITSTSEEGAVVAPTTPSSGETPGGALSAAPTAATPETPTGQSGPEFAGALIGAAITTPTVGESGETSGTSLEGAAAAGAPAWMIAARRAGNLNCALPTLGGSMIDTCAGGLLGAQSLGSASSSRDTGAAPSTTTVAGAPTGNGDGGSSVGGRPSGPTPGPAPSGASGASAAGGSGLALSAFTLAGLLHLAAPRAMCRLRLSSQPWLTAFFVLIPERPG